MPVMQPQFARNPTDALQCYADAYAEIVSYTAPHILPHVPIPPVFFISADMGLVLAKISERFPLIDASASHVGDGFLVFARPTLYLTRDNHLDPVSGFAWGTNPETHELLLASFAWEPPKLTDFPDDFDVGRRWIGALNALIRQKLAAISPAKVTRHLAKRLQGIKQLPECRIIKLRERESNVGTRPGPVIWSCHWMVRGHWRRLPQGPTWVTAHIKGPQDRPFRAPTPTMFAVVR
jgi:hypothetical protein